MARLSLLALTALTVTITSVAHGVGVVTNAVAAPAPPASRLGGAIQQDVAVQERNSADRNRTLDLREQAARATEERLKADIAARAKSAPAAEKTAALASVGGGGEQFDSLARVYQAMKPARAAAIFEELDLEVQMQVAKRMRDRSIAMILAGMTPKAASELSMALAHKSARMPRPVAPPTATPTPTPIPTMVTAAVPAAVAKR